MKRYNFLFKMFYFLAWVTLGMAVAVLPTHAQDETTDNPDIVTTEDTIVQGCAECHIDVVAQWQDSPHATTFAHETVQAAVNEEGSTCLSCHSTGFQAFSGEFMHQSVTCEACHGVTPADHPDEAIAVNVDVGVCADCHTTTYTEWQSSAHGAAELECSSCHDPHRNSLRFETSNALCINCHEQDGLDSYAHTTHIEQACTDCHWHHGEFDTDQHVLTGALMPSGHDSNVETVACTTCHENAELAEAGEEDAEPVEVERVSLVELRELEAEIESVRALGTNIAAVRLIQGGVVGIALGGVLMFGFMRLRPGQGVEQEPEA